MRSSDRSNVVRWKISSPQIVCIHVVPDFGGQLTTMSPGRAVNDRHRPLSQTPERYRTSPSPVTSA